MSDEGRVHHVYDGIEEQDNRLPNWWLGILWGTLLFGVGYWLYYPVTGLGPDQRTEFAQDQAALEAKLQALKPSPEAMLAALEKDPALVAEGRALFGQTCATCHGAQAQGNIGPNLTDGFWLNGGRPQDILRVVAEGSVTKGMPAWERTLGPQKVQQLVAYVLSIRNTHVAGKPPQGEPVQ